MICKITYKRKLARREIVVPMPDVWSGAYYDLMFPIYREHRDVYAVKEFREGIVISLPSDIVDDIPVPEFFYESKQKIKIQEVFKKCQEEKSIVKPS